MECSRVAREPASEERTEPLGRRPLRRLRTRARLLFTKSNLGLLIELTRAFHKVGEYNSVLGVLWSLIAPVGMLAVMYFVFSTRYGGEVKAYPLYLLIGILLVNFFSTVTGQMIGVFLGNVELLVNSSVPRETLVLSRLAVHLIRLLAQVLLCAVLSGYYGLLSWTSLLLMIPLLISYLSLVLSVGLVLGLLYCFARDVEYIWGLASPLLFFATPVFYSVDGLTSPVRELVYWLNPLTPFLMSFRDVLTGAAGVQEAFWHSLALGVVALAVGYSIFMVLESTAVERV